MGLGCPALVLQRREDQRGKGLASQQGSDGGLVSAPPPSLSWALLTGPGPRERRGSQKRPLLQGGANLSPPKVTLQGEPEGGVIRGLTWEMRQPR